jgi:membrane fusion protein, multidrug efflux system
MRRYFAIAIATALFAVSAMIVVSIEGCGMGADSRSFAMPPMPVEVSTVVVQRVVDNFEAVGTIEATEAIAVVGEIDATVKSLPFREGGYIKQGDLIAQLDDAQLAAEVSRAEALREQSKLTYERVKSIVNQGAGAPQDLDDAGASLKVADANLALARARLGKTRIVAPFNGIIGARRISVGAFLRAGQSISDLANIDEIRVIFSAPERFLSRLDDGATVNVSSPAFPGVALPGHIAVIEPTIDQTTRSARIVARVPNIGRKFRPGMSANISALLGARPNAITVPNEAVFGSGNQTFVFVVKPDSTVARVALGLGTRSSDVVEVVTGLQTGMLVVRAGHQKLYDGAKVVPIPSAAKNDTTNAATGG